MDIKSLLIRVLGMKRIKCLSIFTVNGAKFVPNASTLNRPCQQQTPPNPTTNTISCYHSRQRQNLILLIVDSQKLRSPSRVQRLLNWEMMMTCYVILWELTGVDCWWCSSSTLELGRRCPRVAGSPCCQNRFPLLTPEPRRVIWAACRSSQWGTSEDSPT